MKLEEAITKIGINQSEAARILGSTPANISSRIKSQSELTVSEMILLEDAKNIPIYRDMRKQEQEYDLITIPYLEIEGMNTKQFKVSTVYERVQFDREIIENCWNRIPENLRWFPMLGNTMNAGEYPLNNNDILLIDVSSTDALKAGIYVYTTVGGVFINGITTLKSGDIQFIFLNKKYPNETYAQKELEKMKFKIVGRMVKNLSLTK